MKHTDINQIVSHLFRTESGRMASVLTRLLGFKNFQTADDIVQDTLLQAVSTWKIKGVPENPAAWLYTVAKRKAIDELRKQKVRESIDPELSVYLSSEYSLSQTVSQFFLENEIEDSQLRMIFALCHPSLPYESQIALALKTLCGLSVSEIARCFLTNEETITKRLFRAREKLREENIRLEVPGNMLVPRLDAVHHCIYLLFNEGYNSSHPDDLIREELCAEAIRLALILTVNQKTNTPSTNALLALMCLQAARDNARLDADKRIVLLKEQDRSKWNQPLIERGLYYLNVATATEAVSEYHIEAAIAGYHVMAPSFEEINWKKIVSLYEALEKYKSHPIISLNKAIAIRYADGTTAGLSALLQINGLENSHLFYSAMGDFYKDEGSVIDARIAYENSLRYVTSRAEKDLILEKLSSLS